MNTVGGIEEGAAQVDGEKPIVGLQVKLRGFANQATGSRHDRANGNDIFPSCRATLNAACSIGVAHRRPLTRNVNDCSLKKKRHVVFPAIALIVGA